MFSPLLGGWGGALAFLVAFSVGITDGEGSYSWDVTCTKEGHVELYDRTKGLFMQFLRKGVVESDVVYSWEGSR